MQRVAYRAFLALLGLGTLALFISGQHLEVAVALLFLLPAMLAADVLAEREARDDDSSV